MKNEITIEEKKYEILKMLGYPIITKVVSYESGMDFHGDYDKKTIYSNKPPILRKHKESDLFTNPRTFDNYFDWGKQENDFKYKNDFYDTSWDDLMNTCEFIQKQIIQNNNEFCIEFFEGLPNVPTTFVSCGKIETENINAKEAIFEAIYQFAIKYNKN